jgi:hypothetical protein
VGKLAQTWGAAAAVVLVGMTLIALRATRGSRSADGRSGVTVASLKQRGAVALDDAQLKALVVGKTVSVRNTVTGQRLEILYGTNGRRIVVAVDGKPPKPGVDGSVLHSGEMGGAAEYGIANGLLSTTVGNDTFDMTVYKIGDRYIAARGSEFGYANYEVEVARQ